MPIQTVNEDAIPPVDKEGRQNIQIGISSRCIVTSVNAQEWCEIVRVQSLFIKRNKLDVRFILFFVAA